MTMTNASPSNIEELKRVSALLDTALELEDDARQSWLENLKATAPAIHAQVEKLLDANERAARAAFLDKTITPETLDVAAQPIEKIPATLGPYRLIRQIGAGGMSTVWLAERAYPNFVKHVAIKRLPAFLKGAEHQKRLLREAAILGGLNHPNIAQFLDAGVTEEGDPYIVLELIEGESVTAYCDRLRLGVRERVALMATVCEAVAFLHRHSVVHRDIKPSNVMVDQSGTAKILDFGIAKLLDDVLPNEVTRPSVNAFTPEYAAPEQVSGKEITTATDVYSLGVLLYRILTGTRPYARTAPPLLVASAIVSTMPSRPSTLFGPTGDLPHEELTQIAESRRSSVRQMHTSLRNDLDNVLLKALEKDIARRYATVDAFSADLRAYLEARPVKAQAASPVYVMRKFAERHRGGVLAGGLIAAGFAASLGFGAWQVRQTHLEAQRTKSVLGFMQSLIAEANPNNTGVQTITVLDLLKRAPDVAKRQFPEDALLQFESLKPIERILRDLEAAESLEPVEKAMVEILPTLSRIPTEEAMELRSEYALTLAYLGKFEAAHAVVQQTLGQLETTGQRDSVLYAHTLMRQATLLNLQRKNTEAAELATRSHAMLVEKVPADSSLLIKSASNLVQLLINAGRRLEADEVAKKSFTTDQISAVTNRKEQLQYRMLYASLRSSLGDPHAAASQYDLLMAESEKFFGKHSAVYPTLLHLSARAALETGEFEKAANLFEEAIVLEQRAQTKNTTAIVIALSQRATAYLQLHDLRRARQEIEKAADTIKNGAKSSPSYWQAVFHEALLLQKFDDALAASTKQDQELPSSTPADSLTRGAVMLDQANIYRLQKEYIRAIELNKRTISIYRKHLPENHFRLGRAELQLAQALAGAGQLDEALELAGAATKKMEAALHQKHPLVLQANFVLGQLQEQVGDLAGVKKAEKAALEYQRQLNRPISQTVLRLH